MIILEHTPLPPSKEPNEPYFINALQEMDGDENPQLWEENI